MSDVATHKTETDAEARARADAEAQAKEVTAAAEKRAALIAEQQKSITPDEQRAFDALEDSAQQRRANLTLGEQRDFDADEIGRENRYGGTRAERQIAFGALTAEQRKAYLGLDTHAGEAPTQQHIDEEFFAQLTYAYVTRSPLSDQIYNECVHRFKTLNAEPPATQSASRTSHAQASRDEAEAERRYQKGK